MTAPDTLASLSRQAESILGYPFQWCPIPAGKVLLLDASDRGVTASGTYEVAEFAMGKYLITNGQYQRFAERPGGFEDPQWWGYSAQAIQWRKDHPHPRPATFPGADLPYTRVSWFDSVAFCNWLSAELTASVRLPTEQEWQRAAVGDSGWRYPWGNELDDSRGNYANRVRQVSPVGSFPAGQSPFGVMDMVGNLWEWCLTIWGTEEGADLSGYHYRCLRGGAWNVSNPDYLRATDRGEGHSPRGRLNDCGFRVMLDFRKRAAPDL